MDPDQELTDEHIKMLEQTIKDCETEIQEQSDREKLDPPERVRLVPQGCISWRIFTREVWLKGEKDPQLELAWGFGANMTEEQRKTSEWGSHFDRMFLKKEFAKLLRDDLDRWLKE